MLESILLLAMGGAAGYLVAETFSTWDSVKASKKSSAERKEFYAEIEKLWEMNSSLRDSIDEKVDRARIIALEQVKSLADQEGIGYRRAAFMLDDKRCPNCGVSCASCKEKSNWTAKAQKERRNDFCEEDDCSLVSADDAGVR